MAQESSNVPFKESLNRQAVELLAQALQEAWPKLDSQALIETACEGLDDLELKARVVHISDAFKGHLPNDFNKCCQLFLFACKEASESINGFKVWPMTRFIARFGLEDVETSLAALKGLTEHFTGEFAIRPFLIHHPQTTLQYLAEWTEDQNHHVRRLCSEGTRTRLPWGERLRDFQEDPEPVLLLLEALKDDPEDYVRRSVANNLNDLSKDHPELVLSIAESWLKDASKERVWIVKHALRGLVKQGHPRAFEVLGFGGKDQIKLDKLSVGTPEVTLGNQLNFSFSLQNTGKKSAKIVIDYAVHHMKKNGSLSPKVFKLSQKDLEPGQSIQFEKSHPMRAVTVRKYYSGKHQVEILVNGVSQGIAAFELSVPS